MTRGRPRRGDWPRSAPVGAAIAIVLATLGAVLLTLPSCEGLPSKTCFGERANSITVDGGALDFACTSCLQTRCCDLVGYCDEEQGCLSSFKEAHQCVLDAGSAEESACIDRLGSGSSRGRRLYDCMRERCGDERIADAPCAVSSCNVDPSVVLFASPPCDKCMGGSCCRQINACYRDRRCKLAIECIVRSCQATLGQEMATFGERGGIDEIRRAVCEGGPSADVPPASLIAGDCVEQCLTSFAPVPGTADDRRARCLAFEVYSCGVMSGCAGACTDDSDASVPDPDGGRGDDGGLDASDDASR